MVEAGFKLRSAWHWNSCPSCVPENSTFLYLLTVLFQSVLLNAEACVATQQGSTINVLELLLSLVWWPSCQAAPGCWFQLHHWAVLDNLPRPPKSPWVSQPPSQTAEGILFIPNRAEYFQFLEAEGGKGNRFVIISCKKHCWVTHSLQSGHYSCQSLISSPPCNTEKEKGRKDESPQEARKDKTTERENKAVTLILVNSVLEVLTKWILPKESSGKSQFS